MVWRSLTAVVIAPTLAVGCGSSAKTGSTHTHPVSWTRAFAETRVLQAPPPRWVKRGWQVVRADCSGLGQGSRRRGIHVYRDLSCEISVVRPLTGCPSSGIYACVAGFEATAELRTLHVLDATRYALYRAAR